MVLLLKKNLPKRKIRNRRLRSLKRKLFRFLHCWNLIKKFQSTQDAAIHLVSKVVAEAAMAKISLPKMVTYGAII